MPRITPRAEWGAKHANGAGSAPLPARGLRLHHSTTIAPDLLPPFDDDYEAVRTLERIGQQRFGRGISYTFAVTPVGLVFEGHGIDRLGSHTRGYNTVERAVVLVGNYQSVHPTGPQLDAVAWLLVHGWLSGWWPATDLTGGHRDTSATLCPGDAAYAAIPTINARAKAMADTIFGGDMIPGWAKEAIDWAKARGILRGEVRPNDPVTRAEMVTMLHRAFTDEGGKVPGWAADAYRGAGSVLDHPQPNAPMTEARIVTLLHKLGLRR